MSKKWIHGLQPEIPREELTPDQLEVVDGQLRPKDIPRGWKDGIRLIINGGSNKLDAATVPIEWRFSNELLAEEPQYIVICDHEMPLDELEGKEYFFYGRRYLVKVTDCAKYLQLFKSGVHHLIFLVFCGNREKALERARTYMKSDNYYEHRIYYRDVMNGFDDGWHGVPIYVACVEFEVPKGLLAERPQSGFWKYLCFWANLWFSKAPIDECAQRKRYPLALVTPPLYFLWRLIFGALASAYTLVAWFIVGLFGWRPKSVLPNLKNSWVNTPATKFDMVEFARWRYWKKSECSEVDGRYVEAKYLPIWAVPWILAIELGLPYALYRLYLVNAKIVKVGGALVGLILLVCLIGILIDILVKPAVKNMSAKRASEKEERLSSKSEIEYKKYLRSLSTMSIDNAPIPDKVDIEAIIKKVDKPVQFRLRFWATKAKVCRPFSR